MELTMYGFQVYEAEVDDRGIDLVARYERGPFLQIQVKSLRKSHYLYMPKSTFALDDCNYLAFALLLDGQAPDLYLIPSTRWRTPDTVFVDYDYAGKKSKPEYGLSRSGKTVAALARMLLPRRSSNSSSRLLQATPDRRPHLAHDTTLRS